MRSALYALWIFAGTAACAQESAAVSLSNGVQLRITTQSSKGNLDGLKTEIQPASGNSFYRIYRDENGLAVFAYELAVERSADGTQFRVAALPCEDAFAARFPDATGGKPTPTIMQKIESVLASGASFSIEIPANPGLQMTVTDVVQVQINQRGVPVDAGPESSPQIRFVSLRVRAGGSLVSGPTGAIVSGRYAMFYVPGRGGYFFSLEPVDRREFLHAGVVDRAKLNFTVDNENYECESDLPILTKSEREQIWLFHDPNYKPGGNWTKSDTREGSHDEFFTAASDSLNWWLP